MAVYNLYDFPMFSKVKEDDIVAEARNIFDTYADDVQVEPFTGEVSIRNAVRLSEDSPYKDAMLSEDDFVELERRMGLFTHLRNDDSGTGKSNIDYICDYKLKKEQRETVHLLEEAFLNEKELEEKEMYHHPKECETVTSYNRFLNEIDGLK